VASPCGHNPSHNFLMNLSFRRPRQDGGSKLGSQNLNEWPAGEKLTHHAVSNAKNGVRWHVYKQPRWACRTCVHRELCASKTPPPNWRRSITRNEEPAATVAFKARMKTEEAQKIYKQRSQIAEFPHAWIKQRCGLRQFRCRGRWKAAMEATWACLSYNITRWLSIRSKLNAAAVA
jgi:Transposase DDE domain